MLFHMLILRSVKITAIVSRVIRDLKLLTDMRILYTITNLPYENFKCMRKLYTNFMMHLQRFPKINLSITQN